MTPSVQPNFSLPLRASVFYLGYITLFVNLVSFILSTWQIHLKRLLPSLFSCPFSDVLLHFEFISPSHTCFTSHVFHLKDINLLLLRRPHILHWLSIRHYEDSCFSYSSIFACIPAPLFYIIFSIAPSIFHPSITRLFRSNSSSCTNFLSCTFHHLALFYIHLQLPLIASFLICNRICICCKQQSTQFLFLQPLPCILSFTFFIMLSKYKLSYYEDITYTCPRCALTENHSLSPFST